MCIVEVYLVFLIIRRKIRNGKGNVTVEYLGGILRGILKRDINSSLYYCFPSLPVWPHTPRLLIESATSPFDR